MKIIKEYLLIDRARKEMLFTDDIADDFCGFSVACIDDEDLDKEIKEITDNWTEDVYYCEELSKDTKRKLIIMETENNEFLGDLVDRIKESEGIINE